MSDRQIHINRAGQAYGPYPEGRAQEMLAEGQLLPTDLAWYEGAADWKPLNEMLGPTPAGAQAALPPPPKPAVAPKRQVMTGAEPQEEEGDPDLIHITREGKAIGPYSRERAKVYFARGTLLPTDWGWHDGMGEEWKPLNEVLGLLAEEAGSSKYNPAQTKRRSASLLKEKHADRRRFRMLLIFVALDATLVGFIGGNEDLDIKNAYLDPTFLDFFFAALFAVVQLLLGYKINKWMPLNPLQRLIYVEEWGSGLERIQGDWKKPYALVTLVGLIAFFVSFMLFN